MNVLPQLVSLLPTPVIKSISRSQWKHPILKRYFGFGAKMLRGKDDFIRKGVAKGLRFNAGNANAGFLLGTSEPAVQAVLQGLTPVGGAVYDIGANVGFLSIVAAKLVGSEGRVVCFEPLPENVERLRHNADLNSFRHVSVHGVAVGAENGSACFVTSAEPTWGRLAAVPGQVAHQTGQIEVELRTLDSLVQEHRLPIPDLIKIDVEGAEVDVLRGAQKLLREHRPILLIELHGTNTAVEEKLAALNYTGCVIAWDTSIADSAWDAYVVAIPNERSDLLPSVRSLCKAQTSSR